MRYAIALCLLLGACASTRDVNPGGEWRLVGLKGHGVLAPAPTLSLVDGQATGHAGCNRFNGVYRANATGIEIGPLASTRMACADEARTRQETVYLDVVSHARTVVASGGRLALDGPGGEAIFERAD